MDHAERETHAIDYADTDTCVIWARDSKNRQEFENWGDPRDKEEESYADDELDDVAESYLLLEGAKREATALAHALANDPETNLKAHLKKFNKILIDVKITGLLMNVNE